MKLGTSRLIMRPAEISDARDLVKNLNNLNVTKWINAIPFPYTLQDAESWIHRNMEKWERESKDDCSFVTELRKTGQVVGGCGLDSINGHSAAIGYWLGEKYHGKGLGTEMLRALLEFGFNTLGLKRIEATIFPGNTASGKLLEKFGFREEGVKRQAYTCMADGRVKDGILYGLLKNEFNSPSNDQKL